MSEIQAIGFYKEPYGSWTQKKAESWLKKNGFKPLKEVHMTKNMLHYRLSNPHSKKFKKFKAKIVGSGKKKILLTIGFMTCSGTEKSERRGGLIEPSFLEPQVSERFETSGPLVGEETRAMQDTYPTIDQLRENKFLKPVIADSAYHRVGDMTSFAGDAPYSIIKETRRPLIPTFAENTLLGYITSGKMGYPYGTSASTYTPYGFQSLNF